MMPTAHSSVPSILQQRSCMVCKQLQTSSYKSSRVPIRKCAALAETNADTSQLPLFDTPAREKRRRGRPRKLSVPDIGRQQSSNGSNASQLSHSNSSPSASAQQNDEQQLANIRQGDVSSNVNSSQHVPAAAVTSDEAPAAADAAAAATPHDTAADTTTAAAVDATSTPDQGELPPENVWRHQLRHFTGIMANPNRPWVEPFILKHCYIVNTPETRAKFMALTPADMHKLLKGRQQLEQRLAKSAHAISAAWKRLQLLSEAVGDRGQVLTEQQMNKEREQVVQMLEFLKDGQKILARTVTAAANLSDQRYLNRAATYKTLLSTMTAVAESYLREYLRRIGAASRLNSKFQQQWQETPEGLREPVHVLEGRRQQQLLQLQALAPEHPTQLLADYRTVAIDFECAKDSLLFKRRPSTGQPTSTGGLFWQQHTADGALPLSSSPATAGHPQQLQQQESAVAAAATWQQDPRQLMARPLQQLPLLPHLGRHQQWLPQAPRWQRQRQQQQEPPLELLLEQQQQQQQGVSNETGDELDIQGYRAQQLQAARIASKGLSRPELPQSAVNTSEQPYQYSTGQAVGAAAAAGVAGTGTNRDGDQQLISFSGKVLPPFPVLLQRAIQLEEKLIREAERKRAKFSANNAQVQALRNQTRKKQPSAEQQR